MLKFIKKVNWFLLLLTAAIANVSQNRLYSGTLGGKTGKTAVLPRFCKIGRGGGSAPPYYGGLSCPVRARRAGGAAALFCLILLQGIS
jgi:hypothetical protein